MILYSVMRTDPTGFGDNDAENFLIVIDNIFRSKKKAQKLAKRLNKQMVEDERHVHQRGLELKKAELARQVALAESGIIKDVIVKDINTNFEPTWYKYGTYEVIELEVK